MEFASPRWTAYDDTNAPGSGPRVAHATYAVSAQYAAHANRKGVFARRLASSEHYKRLFRYEDDRPWFQPVLAFSTLQAKLLAIATGVQILVFDVDTKKVAHALKGNGRIVTALAWAESKPGILATGAVDGSICVWSLKHSARPLYHVRAFHGACNHVAFNPKDHELLAGCHKNCISVWALPSTKPFLVTKSKDSEFKALRWFATDPLRVLGISLTGSVSIYDVTSALKTFRKTPPRAMNDGDEEDTMFGKLDDVGYMPALDFQIGLKVGQAMLVGRNGLIVLPRDGHILFFIAFFAENHDATELWRLRLDELIDCFSLRVRDRTVQIVACMGQETQSYEVPGTVLDGMGWDFSATTNNHFTSKIALERALQARQKMRPELSIFQRLGQPPQSKKAPVHGPGHHIPEPRKRELSPPARRAKTSFPATLPTSLTSSLELPTSRADEDEHDSPMPFLSPSIPARRTSLGHTVVSLDESLRLPPRASFDSITSTAGHDSDSDDETFAEHLQGSGSFLPGGVNVPLPRTCGARFGPSGQLLTFFLTHTKPASVHGDLVTSPGRHEMQDSEVARLFPSFGNLAHVSRANAVMTDFEGGVSPGKRMHFGPHNPVLPTSLENDIQWSTRVSPVKATKIVPAGQQKVTIAVHEVEALQHAPRLALEYRLLPREGEDVAELCLENAQFALGASLDEAAEMWRLLASLLEHRTCDTSTLALQARYPAIGPASRRPILSRNLSLASSYAERTLANDDFALNWLRHPLGRSWAIERILHWAELQADLQLLACVSSLLIRVSEATRAEAARGRTSVVNGQDTMVYAPQTFAGAKTPPSIPLLRTGTDLTEASLLDESSAKPYSSRTSSRDPSLPNTPYIDSFGSTPPFGLPLARHNTRLSASGSASPEAHRGSFSAAAKYYAQTISDKLAGYSISPPTRRHGTSPGNELSTSLPVASGSWSKSVSFATSSDTLQDSRRSLSLAQEDDNYESDRTIDEMSLPRTPTPSTGVIVRELNGQSFYDDQFTTLHDSSFLPENLVSRCSIWRKTYAEQLRSWDLVIEAAELENIADLAGVETTNAIEQQNSKVVPHMDPQCRGVICCICHCSIKAAKQLCPACLHTTHPQCLDEFVARFDEVDDRFTCPEGCGCECTIAGQNMYELIEDNVTEQPDEPIAAQLTLQGHFAKKRSLTDPRLLRDQLEGNSW